jgi:hypothetical protein
MEFRDYELEEYLVVEASSVDVLLVRSCGRTGGMGDRHAIELRIGGLGMCSVMEPHTRYCGGAHADQPRRGGFVVYGMAAA